MKVRESDVKSESVVMISHGYGNDGNDECNHCYRIVTVLLR